MRVIYKTDSVDLLPGFNIYYDNKINPVHPDGMLVILNNSVIALTIDCSEQEALDINKVINSAIDKYGFAETSSINIEDA